MPCFRDPDNLVYGRSEHGGMLFGGYEPEPTAPGRKKEKPRSARSLLALFMLALVAAATGGIFMLKCEHEPSTKVTLP